MEAGVAYDPLGILGIPRPLQWALLVASLFFLHSYAMIKQRPAPPGIS